MNTNDLNYPMLLEQQLAHRLDNQLKAAPNFSSADKAFGSFMSNPSLMRGPGGGIIDPRTEQNIMGSNWLQERGQIADQSLQNKDQIAGLLTNIGSSIGNMFADQVGLNAQQISGGGGLFGGAGGFL